MDLHGRIDHHVNYIIWTGLVRGITVASLGI